MTTPPQFDHHFFTPDTVERPIFVVGCHRSGTTLMQLLIDQAPTVSMLHETWFVTRIWQRRWSSPMLTGWQPYGVPLVDDWIALLQRDGFDFDGDTYRRELFEGRADLGRVLSVLGRQRAARDGVARWGEKTPFHVHMIPVLARMFPRASFVHMARDGRDVAASVIQQPFTRITDVLGAVIDWRRSVEAGLGAGADANLAGRLVTVRYEDLVTQPLEQLPVVAKFLGLELDPERALNFHQDAEANVPDVPWMQQLRSGMNAGSVGRWRTDIPRADQNMATALARPALEALGYVVDAGDLDTRAQAAADRLWAAFSSSRADQAARRDDHIAMHRGWYRDLLNGV